MKQELTGYPSINKSCLKYYSEEAINVPLPECTVFQNIWQNNKNHLSDIALEYYGHNITYDEVFKNAERCAKALKQTGVIVPKGRSESCRARHVAANYTTHKALAILRGL